jgi:hypothetical protein
LLRSEGNGNASGWARSPRGEMRLCVPFSKDN